MFAKRKLRGGASRSPGAVLPHPLGQGGAVVTGAGKGASIVGGEVKFIDPRGTSRREGARRARSR